ncbi:MAG: hypothetical protein AVDCRST_MAG11-362, partial [uncultured Gemmatimonadaceae bacterium]
CRLCTPPARACNSPAASSSCNASSTSCRLYCSTSSSRSKDAPGPISAHVWNTRSASGVRRSSRARS